MRRTTILVGTLFTAAYAFPWVADQPGVDSSMLPRRYRNRARQQVPEGAGSAELCPFNPNHVPAAPVTKAYPYNNAKNGLPGNGKGGFLVPHPDDPDHQYIAPTAQDIRGPCPGLNTAANHGFLARDGIVTFAELVDAQQNIYNVGYDLANVLAILGLTLTDGDIATERLSIGCDATTRTSINPVLTGAQPGLDGHNKFEADTSLTRNDFFTHGGDNFKYNQTLFQMMTETTGANYNLPNLALYRKQRYEQSLQENANFYFGPFSLLLFGAASFLYELMPSGTRNFAPDYETISSFFIDERIPDNWTPRNDPYDVPKVGSQIFQMYLLHPVQFGFNTAPGVFNAMPDWGDVIKNGTIPSTIDPAVLSCALYQLATERVPSSFNGFVTPTVEGLAIALSKLNPIFNNLGCPINLT